MTKLIIQIPCFNEAQSLPGTIAALPGSIPGIDQIEILVIDDGSTDGTSNVARECGVHHVVRHRRNRGLAAAFQTGLDAALERGAEIIVNTDADNQYEAADIPALIAQIMDGRADIVIGDRGVSDNEHFHPVKRLLQRLGSAIVRRLSGVAVHDAVSGFRAMSRQAAQQIVITTDYSYTTEMLIQAGRRRLAVATAPIRTNGPVRPSRLFNSIPQFVITSGSTIVRAYAMYNALKTFVLIGACLTLVGLIPISRFLYFFFIGESEGHIQSLILGSALLILGTQAALLGILADIISANRKLTERALERLKRLEERLATGDWPAA